MEQYQLLENFRAPLWPDGWEDPALPSLHLNEVLCDVNIYLVLHLLSNWLSHSTLQFPGSREEAGLHTQQGWILWTLVCILPFFTHVLFFYTIHWCPLLGKIRACRFERMLFPVWFSDFIQHEKRNNFHYSIRLPSKMSWMKFLLSSGVVLACYAYVAWVAWFKLIYIFITSHWED